MKHLLRLLACGALLTVSAWPALAQDTGGATAATAASAQDEEACNELYRKFYDLAYTKKDKAGANTVAEEYVQKCPSDNDYLKASKKYILAYKLEQLRKQLYDALKGGKFDDAFSVGKEYLALNDTDVQAYYDLTRAGGAAADAKNVKNNADTVIYAKKTLAVAEGGGKLPPKVTKDMAFGEAYYALGTVAEKPEDQIAYLLKAAQTQLYGKDSGVYFKLALAYQEGEYSKNEATYNAAVKQRNDADHPEVKAALKAFNESSDRLIDALARTIVYATTADAAPYKNSAMPLITGLYKFRNKTDVGLQPFISGITGKPLPKPGEPIDYFPPPVAATPAMGTGTGTGTTTMPPKGAGATTPPANGATGGATATPPANGTKTAGKAPVKGKPKPKGKKG
jgi:hypothetical protein